MTRTRPAARRAKPAPSRKSTRKPAPKLAAKTTRRIARPEPRRTAVKPVVRKAVAKAEPRRKPVVKAVPRKAAVKSVPRRSVARAVPPKAVVKSVPRRNVARAVPRKAAVEAPRPKSAGAVPPGSVPAAPAKVATKTPAQAPVPSPANPVRPEPAADAKLYRPISEVADVVGVKAHVLRYWETQFSMLRPRKNRAGNRMYRPEEVQLLLRIKELLYDRRFTIAGARSHLVAQRKEAPPTRVEPSANDTERKVLLHEVRTGLRQLLGRLREPGSGD